MAKSLLWKKAMLTLWVLCFLMILFIFQGTTYAAGISPASRCNPVAVDTCGLPFPSDVFRNLSGTYNYSDDILDRRVSGTVRPLLPARLQFPETFLPAKVLNQSQGFSPIGPVLFELSDWPIEEIPKSGDGYLHVYNMESGERVPMVVSLSKAAKAERSPLRDGRPVIIAWPRSRLEFGERYVAVLFRDRLNAQFEGSVELFTPNEGVQNALSRNAGWVLNLSYGPVVTKLEDWNIDLSNILSFTWFTVKSEQEITAPMQQMISQALEYPGYVTGLESVDHIGDSDTGLATLKGLLSVVNYRSEDGGVHPPYEPVIDISRRRVEFLLSLPKVESNNDVPVTVFGHGLAGNKSSTKSAFVLGNRLGTAVLAMDHPNHGVRATGNEQTVEPHISMAVSSPLGMMHLLGMFVQAVVDQNLAIHAAKHYLPQSVDSFSEANSVALPSIDNQRVVYDGLSLGAMLGVAIGALSNDLDGTYLVNGTGSLIQVFSESTFWPYTSNVVPANMNGAELTFVMAMMQHYLDIADGHSFAHYYRSPPMGYKEKPLVMHYSLGDGSVPNDASRAVAEIANLPLLKEVIEEEPNIRFGDVGLSSFESGYGLIQSGYGYVLADETLSTIEALDLEGIELPGLPNLSDIIGLENNESSLPGFIADQLEGILGVDETTDLNILVDQIYAGDMADFLTHFNRNNEAAVHRAIEWRCDIQQLPADRCDNAKVKASEEAKEFEELGLDEDDEINPIDDVQNAIENGISNISVVDNSGGSLGFMFIAFGCALCIIRRRLWI